MVELLTKLEKEDLDIYDEIYAFEKAINSSGYGQAYLAQQTRITSKLPLRVKGPLIL